MPNKRQRFVHMNRCGSQVDMWFCLPFFLQVFSINVGHASQVHRKWLNRHHTKPSCCGWDVSFQGSVGQKVTSTPIWRKRRRRNRSHCSPIDIASISRWREQNASPNPRDAFLHFTLSFPAVVTWFIYLLHFSQEPSPI